MSSVLAARQGKEEDVVIMHAAYKSHRVINVPGLINIPARRTEHLRLLAKNGRWVAVDKTMKTAIVFVSDAGNIYVAPCECSYARKTCPRTIALHYASEHCDHAFVIEMPPAREKKV